MGPGVLLVCTGCGETFTGSPRLVGALCGQGRVRLATAVETAEWHADDPVCTCEQWPMPFPCEVH